MAFHGAPVDVRSREQRYDAAESGCGVGLVKAVGSVTVAVMHVGRVLVLVIQGLVAMDVRVLSLERWVVRVRVVRVVVAVRVLVLGRLVRVSMSVVLGDVEIHTQREQPGGGEGERPRTPVAERPCDRRADERRECEHRARSSRADAALRE